MQRKVTFAPDEYYHIYNRGVDKRPIFMDQADWLRFWVALYSANNTETVHLSDYSSQGRSLTEIWDLSRSATLVDVGAYCLMPNHFHLLIRAKDETGVSLFLKKLLTGYSMYFNLKYQRTGNLFESRFKAEHVDDDNHLHYLFAYVHLNPVKVTDPENWERKIIPDPVKARSYLRQYPYSSYLDYLEIARPARAIISREQFPAYFSKPQEFADFVKDWSEFPVKDRP